MGRQFASYGTSAVHSFRLLRLRLRPAREITPASSTPSAVRDDHRRRGPGSDSGATGIEYALIACFVALAITFGASVAGNGLNKMFYVIGDKMLTATNAAAQSSN
jgi:Flp pilus assembly pilin Flp